MQITSERTKATDRVPTALMAANNSLDRTSITAASGCNARNSSAIDRFFASGGKPLRNFYFLVLARVEPLHLHVPCETEHSKRRNAIPVEIDFVPS
jgi:hypothetical protein